MKGIQDLIRPCATLARYEAALAAGTITQDVMVFIADVRQIRWKGEIYDCSVTAVTEDGKTYIHADGFNSEDDEYYYLPNSAPDDDPAHTFAMLSDLEGLGGGGGDTGDIGAVAAAGLVDLNERLLDLSRDMAEHYTRKEDFEAAVQELTDTLLDDEEIIAGALSSQAERLKVVEGLFADYLTRDENSRQTAVMTEEIETSEEVAAHAFSDIAAILEDHKRRIYHLEMRS